MATPKKSDAPANAKKSTAAGKTAAAGKGAAAGKNAAVKKTPAKTAEKATTAPRKAVEASAEGKGVGLKLKSLVDSVAEQSSAPKKVVKELTEAVLAALGAALYRGEEFNLPGLGRGKVVKTAEKAGVPVLTLKLKRISEKNGAEGKQALAEDGEDS